MPHDDSARVALNAAADGVGVAAGADAFLGGGRRGELGARAPLPDKHLPSRAEALPAQLQLADELEGRKPQA